MKTVTMTDPYDSLKLSKQRTLSDKERQRHDTLKLSQQQAQNVTMRHKVQVLQPTFLCLSRSLNLEFPTITMLWRKETVFNQRSQNTSLISKSSSVLVSDCSSCTFLHSLYICGFFVNTHIYIYIFILYFSFCK